MKDINSKEIKVGQLARVLSRYYAGYGNVEEQEELKQLVTDFEKMQNNISTGKFPWE